MENKEANQQEEVKLKLTEEQREQIKHATGKLITELKIGTVEERANPVVNNPLYQS